MIDRWGPRVIAYRALLDVPRELVLELAKLLRAERRARGTRKRTRLLSCLKQALLVLVWTRHQAGHGGRGRLVFGRRAQPPTATAMKD